MQTVAIEGTPREAFGKKASKSFRKQGLVPCVAYGGGSSFHFTAPSTAFKKLIYTPDFKIAEITIDGATHRAILKDAQFHPVTDNVMHIDFLLLVEGHKLGTQVPVKMIGTAPGVKLGGKLTQITRRVKIKTLPKHLVNHVEVDISSLDLGKVVRIRDIKPVDGVEIMTSPGIPLASVEIPRALRSAQAAAAKEEA